MRKQVMIDAAEATAIGLMREYPLLDGTMMPNKDLIREVLEVAYLRGARDTVRLIKGSLSEELAEESSTD